MVLRKIEEYLRKNNVAPTRFGRESVRDPRLVFDLRNGREPGPKLSRRIDAYIREQSK